MLPFPAPEEVPQPVSTLRFKVEFHLFLTALSVLQAAGQHLSVFRSIHSAHGN